jgi:hypothetical protein
MIASWLRTGSRSLAFVVALSLVAAVPARVLAAADEREIQAREDFAAGRYQIALEIFARLYAETLHPNYLRNIGRCYQNLGDPDRAITSFRDYLHKGKNISADERAEVEGYIKDMEELKRARAAGAAGAAKPPTVSPPTASSPTVSPPTASLPAAPPPAVEPAPRATVDLTRTAPPAPEESSPVYERWWFWAAVVGVVGAGVGIAAAAGVFTHYQNADCPMGVKCR